MEIDTPEHNDNRKYDYSLYPDINRTEYQIILAMVKSGASVLDLGCGNGALLARLKKEKNIRETGIELVESGVEVCRQRGLNVQQGRIDEQLPFSDNQFEYAICNVTLQMVLYPEIVLKEMKRVAQYQIISFPNFAFWKNRIELLFAGRMPQKMLFGYSWYSTGHLHQFSIVDFHHLVHNIGGLSVIEQRFQTSQNVIKDFLAHTFPNLFLQVPIYLLQKK